MISTCGRRTIMLNQVNSMSNPIDTNEHNRAVWIRKQLVSLEDGLRLLDAGAGEQQYKNSCTHLKYVSQDFAQYKPENIPSGLQMEKWEYAKLDIISDITAIPELDGSFDAILCSEVLEHVPDPVSAIKELGRLTKPGGVLLITAPFCSLTHFAPFHFSTGFNRYFYEHHLPAMGFTIEELSFNGNYFDWLNQELGRLPSIAERYSAHTTSRFEYRKIGAVRKLLKELSMNGNQSTELLAYGCHVRARKSK